MTAIRATFDGKTFIPQQPATLPGQVRGAGHCRTEGLTAVAELDAVVRAYYDNKPDADDDAWGDATSPRSQGTWDED
jgi:hypothetical protein